MVNSVPVNLGEIACGATLEIVKTRFFLDGYDDFYEPCAIYDVYVNGVAHRVQATTPNVRR